MVSSARPFTEPFADVKLEELTHKNFSKDTMKKVKSVVKMFHEWRDYRHANSFERIECNLEDKHTINRDTLVFALPRFLTGVKKSWWIWLKLNIANQTFYFSANVSWKKCDMCHILGKHNGLGLSPSWSSSKIITPFLNRQRPFMCFKNL